MLTALQELGLQGEQVAADYLQSKGWEIVERRYRNGHRDIDLVVARIQNGERLFAFVEVKARSTDKCGGPMGAITLQKKRDICRAAAGWLKANRHNRRPTDSFRFDVVGVILTMEPPPMPARPVRVWHIEDAFWVPL